MKLYYTTSVGTDEVQSKPSLSLGGFKSSSLVVNDDFSNLFDELSAYTLHKNKSEYIGLMLLNDSGNDVENIKLWFVHPENSFSKFKVSGVIPAINEDGDYYIERISTRFSKPVYATFEDADEVSKYDLGSLLNGKVIGIWFKRELLMNIIEEESSKVYEEDPEDPKNYIPVEKETEDSIKINIDWDIVP